VTPNSNPSSIGRRVRAARDHLGWSREALAFHSGLSWSAIAQIEAGRRTNVRPATLSALCDALGVTVDYLLGREGGARPMLEHHALLHASDDEFVQRAGPFLAEGVERSEATLAVTTPARIELLRDRLGAGASEVAFSEARSWYTTPTAALAAYREFIDEKLGSGAGWVRILGEPVWSGRSDAEVALWARYESLLNLEFAALPVTVACPYDTAALPPGIVRQAHATHRHTCADGDIAPSPDYVEPSAFALRS
jgi:transcriptional regulator with XRE-family HTH domain